MNRPSNDEFMATATAERSDRRSRAEAARTMKAAYAFARSGLGRAVLQARAAIGSLGTFGAALLALYPVAIALAVSVTWFTHAA